MAERKKFYTPEYESYESQLGDVALLETYQQTLSDSVKEVIELSDTYCNQLLELAGLSINQLDESSKAFFNEIKSTAKFINNELKSAKDTCKTLKDDLLVLKENDEFLQDRYSDLDEYLSTYGGAPKDGEVDVNYNDIIEGIEYFYGECANKEPDVKSGIQALKDFEAKLEDFSISTFELGIAISNKSAADLEDPDFLKNCISKYTELYEMKRRNLRSNDQDGLVSVLNALGYPYDLSMDGPFNFESFKKLHTFLNTPVYKGKTPADIVNSYFNGESWEESGMQNLAVLIGNPSGMKIQNPSDLDYEAEFWRNMILQIDGGGKDNNPTPYFLMSTDFYKKYGGSSDFKDIYDLLFVDFSDDPNNPNYGNFYDEKGRIKWLNKALIDSLKDEFKDQGYLDGFNNYVNEINQLNDNYGDDVLPFLEALDGRMDWTDNNSVIPKEAILDYINGKSWEDSELSLYCSKSEEEFLKDLVDICGKDYDINFYSNEEYGDNLTTTQNKSWFNYNENKGPSILDGLNGDTSPEAVKAALKSNGVDKKLGDYYDHVDTRNDQIEAESAELYGIATSIRVVKEELGKVEPSEQDLLRQKNKAEGKQMAESFLNTIDTISGKNEHMHIMSQDDYVAMIQKNNPNLSREEILREYKDAWRQEYREDLIRDKNYNPECARRMAEQQQFENKQVVAYDDMSPLESVVSFSRDLIADGAVTTAGLASGTIDLGRNLKHIVAPDLVPSPLAYAQDEIATQYNDPNSKYYDPIKGTLYSATRTIGHEGPILALKAIPQTKVIGDTLAFLDQTGQSINTAYVANGGNQVAATINGLGKAVIDYGASKATAGLSGGTQLESITAKVVVGTGKNSLNNALDVVTGVKNINQAKTDFWKGEAGLAVDTIVGYADKPELTGIKYVDNTIGSLAKGEGKALLTGVVTGDYSKLADQEGILSGTGKTFVTSATSDAFKKGVEFKNFQDHLKSGNYEMDYDGNLVTTLQDGTVVDVDPTKLMKNGPYDAAGISAAAAKTTESYYSGVSDSISSSIGLSNSSSESIHSADSLSLDIDDVSVNDVASNMSASISSFSPKNNSTSQNQIASRQNDTSFLN